MAIVTGSSIGQSNFSQQKTTGTLSTQTLPANITFSLTYENGTGAGAVDLLFAAKIPLATSTPQSIDLTSFIDMFMAAGGNMARARHITFRNIEDAGSGRVLTVGGGTNAYTAVLNGTVTLPPQASFRFDDPESTGAGVGGVTSGTSKVVRLDPGTNPGTAEVIIAGCSAVS
jgi:hypothetical protein